MTGLLLPALAIAFAAVTAASLVTPPAGRSVRSRLAPAPESATGGRRAPWRALAAVAGVLVGIGAGAFWGGGRGAVLCAASAVAVGTVVRVARLHRADRRARRAQAEVARACGVLASYVRVGQVPAEALILVARDCPVLAQAAAIQQVGGDVPDALLAWSGRAGHGGLADLARAWRVSSVTGAPMAPALEEVSSGLASDESLRSVVSAELAAPRSTGKVMAVLPLVGIGLGYLLGGRPLAWLAAGPLGWACLLGGLLLAAAGVLWIERLAGSAAAGA